MFKASTGVLAQINRDVALGKTLQDYAKAGIVKKLEIQPHFIRFEAWGKDYCVSELVRGDYDGDGVEDALIYSTWKYQEGTGRGYEPYLVLKLTPGPVCVVRGLPL